MSLVIRKYLDGGSTSKEEEKKFFEWDGVGKYELEPLVASLTKNLSNYADSKGLKGLRRINFLTNAGEVINAIRNGEIKRNVSGTYESANENMQSNGIYDKTWLGKIKNNLNNSYNDVGGYLDAYFNLATPYTLPKLEDKTKEKFNFMNAFNKALKLNYSGGQEIDINEWFKSQDLIQRRNLLKSAAESLRNLNYDDYDWSDTGFNKESFNAALSDFINNISNGNNDYLSFIRLGGLNLRAYLEEPLQEQETTSNYDLYYKNLKLDYLDRYDGDEELANRTVELAKKEKEREKKLLISEWDELDEINEINNALKLYLENNPFNSLPLLSYNSKTSKNLSDVINKNGGASAYLRNIGSKLYNNTATELEVSDYFNTLSNIYNTNPSSKAFTTLSNGYYVYNPSYYKDYTTFAFDPTTHQYLRVSLIANEELNNIARDLYNLLKKNTPLSLKQGGILYKQEGGVFYDNSYDDQVNSTFNAYLLDLYDLQMKSTRLTSTATGPLTALGIAPERTEELKLAGSLKLSEGLSARDKWRIGNAITDLASTVAAFAPGYGTAASGILGVGSTLSNLGADITDKSVSKGETLSNFLFGIGTDVAGLLPGIGSGAKAAKIAKTLKPVAKTLLAVLTAQGGVTGLRGVSALSKIVSNPSEATVDDLKDLLYGLQALSGGVKHGKGMKNVNDLTTTKRYVNVKDKEGKIHKITQELWDEIKGKKGAEELNKLFLLFTGGLDEMLREYLGRNLRRFQIFTKSPDIKKTTEVEWEINQDPLYRRSWYSNSSVLTREKELAELIAKRQSDRAAWRAKHPNSKKSDEAIDKILDATPRRNISKLPKYTEELQAAISAFRSRNKNTTKTDELILTYLSRPPRVRKPKQALQLTTNLPVLAMSPEALHYRDLMFEKIRLLKEQERAGLRLTFNNATQPQLLTGIQINWLPNPSLHGQPSNLPAVTGKRRRFVDIEDVEPIKEQTRKRRELPPRGWSLLSPELRRLFELGVKRRKWQEAALNSPYIPNYPYPTITKPLVGAPYNSKLAMYNKLFSDENVLNAAIANPNIEIMLKYFKKGGKIKRFLTGNTLSWRTEPDYLSLADTSENAKDISKWDNYYNIDKIINDLKQNGISASDIKVDEILNNLNNLKSESLGWEKKLNDTNYTDWNTKFDTTGLNKYFGSEKSKFLYLGPTTWNRRGLLNKLSDTFNNTDNTFSINNLKIYWDGKEFVTAPTTVTENIVDGGELDEVIVKPEGEKKSTFSGAGNTKSNNILSNISVNPADAIALSRAFIGDKVNKKAAEIYKKGLKPVLTDTYEGQSIVRGDYLGNVRALNYAALLYNQASKPVISDWQKQKEWLKETWNNVYNNVLVPQQLQDANMRYSTQLYAQLLSNEGKKNRIDNANQNRARMVAILAAKALVDSATKTANWSQVWQPFLAGVENNFRQTLAANLYSNMSAALQELQSQYETAYNAAATDEEKNKVIKDYYKLLRNLLKYLNKPYFLILTLPSYQTPFTFAKSGGTLDNKTRIAILNAKDFNKRTLEDNKQFHKDIMDSKKEHNKLIMSLSSLTKDLIKSAMKCT